MIEEILFKIIPIVFCFWLVFLAGMFEGMRRERKKQMDTMIIDEGCFERGCACVDTRVDSKWVTVEMREKL